MSRRGGIGTIGDLRSQPRALPLAVARRNARATGIRPIALQDAWAQRSLLMWLRDLEAPPGPARQRVDWLLQPEADFSRPRPARAG